MSDAVLEAIEALFQEDVGKRGLRTDPASNLVTATAGDFAAACQMLAEAKEPAVGIVTGFFIPTASPPCGETDGPLGALFLARALVPLGMRVVLLTDEFCRPALEAGLGKAGLRKSVVLVTLPASGDLAALDAEAYTQAVRERMGRLTHLVALERVGPSHTPDSVQAQPGNAATVGTRFAAEVPEEHRGRCQTMRGRDITEFMSPSHFLFETAASAGIATIGIGDGGNEIGMGKIAWEVIDRNIPRGGLVACRIATDRLIVAGVSNWGAYGLAAGIYHLRGQEADTDLFDLGRERELLQCMVEKGPLVDGVTNEQTVSVDGLSFERYAALLPRMGEILRRK